MGAIMEKTPLSRPLLVLGIFSLLTFSLLYWQASIRSNQLVEGYKLLESRGVRSFGTIKEYHTSERRGIKVHIYTYTTSDENGRLTDIVEYVDVQTHKKLRIGDTVLVTKKSINLLGNYNLIARIQGNSYPPANHKFLELYGVYGVMFSFLTIIVALVLMAYGKRR